MRYYLTIFTSSVLFNLAASEAQYTHPEGCLTPYFLDCRGIMGEVYADLLFLQPNGSSLYYAAQANGLDESISIPAISPNWIIHEVTPNYSAAFKIGTKMLFSGNNINLEASWEHLYSSKFAHHTVQDAGQMLGPLSDIGPNSAAYTTAHGKTSFHFDGVDLVFGQQLCGFITLYSNMFAAAEFARIKQSAQSTYSNDSASTSREIKTSSTFTGAGPQFGFDFDYRIGWDFFFSGTTSLGLVIGESQNETNYYSDSPYLIANGIPIPNSQTVTVPNRTQLVPSLEERLGFSYTGVFKCCKVKFGAGYLAQIYLNAIQTIDMTAPQVEPSLLLDTVPDAGMFAVGFERTLSNYIMTGPYISLSVDF